MGEYKCELCGMWLNSRAHLRDHLAGKKHRKRLLRKDREPYVPFAAVEPDVTPAPDHVRINCRSLAGSSVSYLDVPRRAKWREIAVLVRQRLTNFRALPPANARTLVAEDIADLNVIQDNIH